MREAKRTRLEKAGWKVGTAAEFLELTREEEELVELRVALAREVRRRREAARLTQVECAKVLHSSQSRVAKMEAGAQSVTLDLLIRSLLALGATRTDVARVIRPGRSQAA